MSLSNRARGWRLIETFTFVIPNDDFINVLKDYSFDLNKDLKKLNLTKHELGILIDEQKIHLSSNKIGNVLLGNKEFKAIIKYRLKFNNVSKAQGLRLIAIVIVRRNIAIVLHVYNKSEKKDLTTKESKALAELYDTIPISLQNI